MKKKYINPTAQAIQLEINPLLNDVQSPYKDDEQTTPSKEHIISNDGPEYDEEL
jgi:hypothetical protein